ncbi:RNA polymerase sigma-70 factor (ECF subfamily) [Armatimonas rosea]|uniref:RNA polymerase sigma-70 factor (ECF subfamily) n=1 Tax=Armatimonas rosea TaxID=685828 RepID=A0A7W9SW76_ARMRO|nr:sigma-70 family RNA polymerase sigma factor [Armatimonas rosea]MBB6053997.1 RNA polymerase sigma-70 factor (ECF subfamily) [Armatimonas rosea]
MVRKALWTAPVVQATTPTELLDRYFPLVLGYVSARLGPGPEAEDTAIAVFGELCLHPKRLPNSTPTEADDPARAYLVGMARRKVALVLRLRGRRREQPLEEPVVSVSVATPESAALGGESQEQLRAALARLPELQREVLLLKYREELSLIEIGQVLGKKPNAVGQLLHRAREALRKEVGDYFDDRR